MYNTPNDHGTHRELTEQVKRLLNNDDTLITVMDKLIDGLRTNIEQRIGSQKMYLLLENLLTYSFFSIMVVAGFAYFFLPIVYIFCLYLIAAGLYATRHIVNPLARTMGYSLLTEQQLALLEECKTLRSQFLEKDIDVRTLKMEFAITIAESAHLAKIDADSLITKP
jgi:hypothetical protein